MKEMNIQHTGHIILCPYDKGIMTIAVLIQEVKTVQTLGPVGPLAPGMPISPGSPFSPC